MSETGDADYVTIGKAASWLGLPVEVMRALVEAGDVPARLVKGHMRLLRSDVPAREVAEARMRALYDAALQRVQQELSKLDVEVEAARNDLAEAMEQTGKTQPLGNDLEALIRSGSDFDTARRRVFGAVVEASVLNRAMQRLDGFDFL